MNFVFSPHEAAAHRDNVLSIPFGVTKMDKRGDRDEKIESKLEHLEVWATHDGTVGSVSICSE